MRLLWHALLWLLFLLLAPAIFAVVPILAIKYASSDEIWLLKRAFGVLAPFAAAFWYLMVVMIPAHNRGEHGLAFHLKSFGAMAVGFLVSAGTMFLGSIAEFVGTRAMEKAAAWKSPKSGLSHCAWKSRKARDFALFPDAPRRYSPQANGVVADVHCHPEGIGSRGPGGMQYAIKLVLRIVYG